MPVITSRLTGVADGRRSLKASHFMTAAGCFERVTVDPVDPLGPAGKVPASK